MQEGLQGLYAAWAEIGLDHYYVPRKTAPEYALVLVHYLREAQRARGIVAPLERLMFIGDTLMLDGSAARNLGQHLTLRGFIGADRPQQPAQRELQGELMVANRWAALADFVAWVDEAGFASDERTVLLLDLDKTSLGPRGRNDKVIDNARVEAIQLTMRAALGEGFDKTAFRTFYDALNQPAYHAFTADNQDYLAYVCLMVMGSIWPADELWRELKGGELTNIGQFVARCDARRATMSPALLAAHEEVYRGIQAEDPTPFKAFRRREYLETISRMNMLPDDASEADVLAKEIVITAEVASVARLMSQRGLLVFGISDKPDEASLPTPEGAARGYRPLHRTVMKTHGQEVV
jgi:hypothetical protein